MRLSVIGLWVVAGLLNSADSVLLNEGRPPHAHFADRSVYARSLPEVFGYSGSLYQPVYGPPLYPGPIPLTAGPHPINAVAILKPDGTGSEDPQGVITLVQPHPPEGPVFLSGNITGLTPGKHGFHVHVSGDLREGCKSLGPHHNPFLVQHGGPTDPYRHVGDLGNIVADEGGVAKVQISDHLISLAGSQNVIGRGLVVHANPDDLGRGGDTESLQTGNAGKRIACGVIALY
ncbi:superoxide dismutase [Cu-Zn]-like [Nilaparvata lugens]|uniref:superoxide dismutase [Cu-Zn]-like n=1 Tax=Nilaparvata lugens TaxID=108931 RepID=UPI00193D8978|nr:superoxide dismutase [Cu-Zn]-like [Nilaparvata lugens]